MNKKIKTLIGMALGLSLFTVSMAGVVGSCEPEEWWWLWPGCSACWNAATPTREPCSKSDADQRAQDYCEQIGGEPCAAEGKVATCMGMSFDERACFSTCVCECVDTSTKPKEIIWEGSQ